MAGTAWSAFTVSGRPVVAASPLTATFTNTTVAGTTGCNDYGGTYRHAAGAITCWT